MKKAQSLSINTIIIAILAILVLVIVGVIFTGRAGLFGREIDQGCVANGGICLTTTEYQERYNGEGYDDNLDYICPTTPPGKVCYIPDAVAYRG